MRYTGCVLAFVLVRVTAVQVLAGHESEHRVAEELEPFVRLARPLAGHAQVRAVGERELQQAGVTERDAELLLELFEDSLLLLVQRR